MERSKLKKSKPWKTFRHSLVFVNDKLIPFVICFLGALTQVTTLLTMYFSYPTLTTLDMYQAQSIDLPAITICYLFDLDPEVVREKVKRNIRSPLTSNDVRYDLTLSELNQVTASTRELIVSCFVANSSSEKNEDCFDASSVKINLNANMKCFTFFLGPEPLFKYHRTEYLDQYFLRIVINMNITSHSNIFLIAHGTEEDVINNLGSPEMLVTDTSYANDFVVTYNKAVTELLEPPYTNCIDYYYQFGASKRNLIKRCMFTSIYEVHRGFNDRNLIPTPSDLDNVTFDKGIKLGPYRSKCEEEYSQPECLTELINLVEAVAEWDTRHQELVTIKFAYPLREQSYLFMLPKYNYLEFYCYIASVIALWLGLSIIDVAHFVFKQTRKFVINLCKTRSNQDKVKSFKWQSKRLTNINRAVKREKQFKLNRVKVTRMWPNNIGLTMDYPKRPVYYLPYYNNINQS